MSDIYYHDEAWESTHFDVSELIDERDPDYSAPVFEIMRLQRIPSQFAARVIIGRTDPDPSDAEFPDGEPDDYEWRLFDSFADAQAAHMKDAPELAASPTTQTPAKPLG